MKTHIMAITFALMSGAAVQAQDAAPATDVVQIARMAVDAHDREIAVNAAPVFERGTVLSVEAGLPETALDLVVPAPVRETEIFADFDTITTVEIGKHGTVQITGTRGEAEKVSAAFKPDGTLEHFRKVKPPREKRPARDEEPRKRGD